MSPFVRSFFLLASLSLSCGGKEPAPTTAPDAGQAAAPEQPAAPVEEEAAAPAGAEVEFAGWAEWTKTNEARFESEGHDKAWVDVYVEAEHAETYRSGAAAPVGMRVVKAHYLEEDAADPVSITVMAKRDRGYDSERGDWYYGVFAPDGTTAKQEGKLDSCAGCHISAAGKDYLFRK